jgi:hypothetical protein
MSASEKNPDALDAFLSSEVDSLGRSTPTS